MALPFSTPETLAEALHSRADGARSQLWEWLREPVRRLMEQLRNRHRIGHSLDRLTQNALYAAETFVRTRPASEFASMSVAAFRAVVLVQLAKQVMDPFGGRRDGAVPMPDPLPESKSYICRTVYLPYEKVGGLWFGGDWYGGMEVNGTLWVMVADITGHGYCASLLAITLPAVWRACWSNGKLGAARPNDVLGAMHDMLHDSLPDGVYAECTLLRLSPDGQVTVAPAGGSRLLLRRAGRREVELLRLRGPWLGLERPSATEEQTCTLQPGDELLIASDGVFDQLIEHAGSSAGLAPLVSEALGTGSLLDAVRSLLDRALRARPQKDDITLVQCRRDSREAARG
jgi:serine phosphatase RsbU (regulator of sigma subunit)